MLTHSNAPMRHIVVLCAAVSEVQFRSHRPYKQLVHLSDRITRKAYTFLIKSNCQNYNSQIYTPQKKNQKNHTPIKTIVKERQGEKKTYFENEH